MSQQIEQIDNALITACITFLAAYVLIFSLDKTENIYFGFAVVSSTVFIASCLLLTLYGKFRESIRKSIFNQQKDKWAKDLESDLDRMDNELVAPLLMKVMEMTLEKKDNKEMLIKNPENLNLILGNEWENWSKDLKFPRKLFAENQV